MKENNGMCLDIKPKLPKAFGKSLSLSISICVIIILTKGNIVISVLRKYDFSEIKNHKNDLKYEDYRMKR